MLCIQAATLLKTRLQRWRFLSNFAKFVKIAYFAGNIRSTASNDINVARFFSEIKVLHISLGGYYAEFDTYYFSFDLLEAINDSIFRSTMSLNRRTFEKQCQLQFYAKLLDQNFILEIYKNFKSVLFYLSSANKNSEIYMSV